MATTTSDSMSMEEFDQRMRHNNDRLRKELADAQVGVERLEILIARKEVFNRRLGQLLADIERE